MVLAPSKRWLFGISDPSTVVAEFEATSFSAQLFPQTVPWEDCERSLDSVFPVGGTTASDLLQRTTWRIIPVSKWSVTLIYKPLKPFGRGITPVRGLTNHGYQLLTKWDDPPSKARIIYGT